MTDLLSQIVERKRERLRAAKSRVSIEALRTIAADTPRPHHRFAEALRRTGELHIIAEIKRASPSKGDISAALDPVALAREYAACGASAISVLTEEDHFRGSLDDLRAVRAAVVVSLLRKDFIVEEYQVAESAAAGADALLLIAACLEKNVMRDLISNARSWGLDALVEVHDEVEMQRAIDAGTEIVGVNNRNLKTFEVDLETSIRLAPLAPKDCILVAESGISGAADVKRLADAGFRNFLVGESLVRSESRASLFSELLSAEESR